MTDYSKQDLRNRVLHDLGVLDISESASAEDAELVDAIVQQSLEELEDENLVIFDSQQGETVENIPGRCFSALADFVRYHAGMSYGVPKDENLRMSALYRLRKSVLDGSDDTPVRVNFF